LAASIDVAVAMGECNMTSTTLVKPSAVKMGIAFGVAFGIGFGVLSGTWIAITDSALVEGVVAGSIAGIVGGPLFGAAMGAFFAWMLRRMAANRPALDGEDVLLEGAANHVADVESRGGWLYLTDDALHFRAHKLNIQRKPLSLPLDEIRDVAPARALGLIPNALTVTTTRGTREKFIVNARGTWIAAIRNAVQRQPATVS
jgi:hypothetical protein